MSLNEDGQWGPEAVVHKRSGVPLVGTWTLPAEYTATADDLGLNWTITGPPGEIAATFTETRSGTATEYVLRVEGSDQEIGTRLTAVEAAAAAKADATATTTALAAKAERDADFTAGRQYVQGELVVQAGVVYSRNATGTPSTFIVGEWTAVGGGGGAGIYISATEPAWDNGDLWLKTP